jgi:hypothetical protein
MADGWCWFVLREEYCWLVAGGWFVLREKYCWLVADKPSEQGGCRNLRLGLGSSDGGKQPSGSLERTTRDFLYIFSITILQKYMIRLKFCKTIHWRSYIKTACEIGLPMMLFIQVVHKAGSSSQVPESDAHQGEAELQVGDGPATEPQEGDGGSTEEEEGDGDTPFEGAIDEGGVNEEVLRRYEMEADEDERGLEEDSSDDEDDPLVFGEKNTKEDFSTRGGKYSAGVPV